MERADFCRVHDASRNPEVGQVCVSLVVEQDVSRLEIPMHKALAVGGAERTSHLAEESEGVRRRPGTVHRRTQCPSPHETHDEVGAVLVSPVVEERHDERMLELGHPPGLGFEATHERRVVGELGPDHLDGHFPADGWLVGAVDDTEGPFAYLLAELVAPQAVAEVGSGQVGATNVQP